MWVQKFYDTECQDGKPGEPGVIYPPPMGSFPFRRPVRCSGCPRCFPVATIELPPKELELAGRYVAGRFRERFGYHAELKSEADFIWLLAEYSTFRVSKLIKEVEKLQRQRQPDHKTLTIKEILSILKNETSE